MTMKCFHTKAEHLWGDPKLLLMGLEAVPVLLCPHYASLVSTEAAGAGEVPCWDEGGSGQEEGCGWARRGVVFGFGHKAKS